VTGGALNLLERLARAGVDFVIVGGFAGVVHGCTYLTEDIDICCDFIPANLLALQQALAELHPVHRMTPGRRKLELTEQNAAQFKNLYLDTDMGPLDCLSRIEGLGPYVEVVRSSEIIQAGEAELRVLSVEALIKTKQAMNRPRDKEAVLQLETLRQLKDRRKKDA